MRLLFSPKSTCKIKDPNGRRKEEAGQSGQALLESVITLGFLVAIALALGRLLRPMVINAFEKIANALTSVGP